MASVGPGRLVVVVSFLTFGDRLVVTWPLIQVVAMRASVIGKNGRSPTTPLCLIQATLASLESCDRVGF